MKQSHRSSRALWQTGALAASGVFILSGCLATRDWVKEQVDPVSGRVTQTENRLNSAEGQISKLDGRMGTAEGKIGAVEGKLTSLDGKLTEVDGKAERALQTLGNLKFERS
jgi:chromosome segregation ATPase